MMNQLVIISPFALTVLDFYILGHVEDYPTVHKFGIPRHIA